MGKYLDSTGLGTLWNKIKEKISDAAPDWNAQWGEDGYIDNRTHYVSWEQVMEGPGEFDYSLPSVRFRMNRIDGGEYTLSRDSITINTGTIHNPAYKTITHDYTNNKIIIEGYCVLYINPSVRTLSAEYIPDSIARKSDIIPAAISLSYSELKALKENLQLIPGQQYIINDYHTSTVQTDTKCIYNKGLILVTALTNKDFDENATYVPTFGKSSDEYMSYSVKYCFDNDTSRFDWANDSEVPVLKKLGSHPSNDYGFTFSSFIEGDNSDSGWNEWVFTPNDGNPDVTVINKNSDGTYYRWMDGSAQEYEIEMVLPGTGVIYWMKDEYGNEAGYDFFNIQFKRYAVGEVSAIKEGTSVLRNASVIRDKFATPPSKWIYFDNGSGVMTLYKDSTQTVYMNSSSSGEYEWFYTFHNIGSTGTSPCFTNNVIKPNYTSDFVKRTLNNTILFRSTGTVYNVSLGDFNYNNTIRDCYNVTLGNSCGRNLLYGSNNVTYKDNCYNNFVLNGSFIDLGKGGSFNHVWESTGVQLGDLNESNIVHVGCDTVSLDYGCVENVIYAAGICTLGKRCKYNHLELEGVTVVELKDDQNYVYLSNPASTEDVMYENIVVVFSKSNSSPYSIYENITILESNVIYCETDGKHFALHGIKFGDLDYLPMIEVYGNGTRTNRRVLWMLQQNVPEYAVSWNGTTVYWGYKDGDRIRVPDLNVTITFTDNVVELTYGGV